MDVTWRLMISFSITCSVLITSFNRLFPSVQMFLVWLVVEAEVAWEVVGVSVVDAEDSHLEEATVVDTEVGAGDLLLTSLDFDGWFGNIR